MHIHYIINSLDGGGAALPVADIVSLLHTYGHDVQVSGLRAKDGRACARLDATGVPYEILGPDRFGTLPATARLWWRLRRHKPDLIWTSVTRATLLGQFAGYALDVPVVSWLHNAFLKPHKKAALRHTEGLTRHWIVDCEATADFAQAELGIPREKMSVWPLLIADPRWPMATPWNRNGPFRIGSLGRLHGNKSYDTLIRAAGRIREQDPSLSNQLEFLIAGVGPQRRPLEEMARAYGLTNVRFIGFKEDVPAFLAGLHAYVQPSHHEGLCVAAHEAMLAGLPVVATAVGELPRSLSENGDRGLLCSIDDSRGLADALMRLARTPETAARTGRRAREYVLSAYSATAFQERGQTALAKIDDALTSA